MKKRNKTYYHEIVWNMGQDAAKPIQHKVSNFDSSYSNVKSNLQSPKDLYGKSTSQSNAFSKSEVHSMVQVYNNLAALSPRDKYIDRKTFVHYFPLDGLLAERLFTAFDKDRNGHIDCNEFLDGLRLCLRGSVEERSQIIFDMFNLDGGDGVSISEIRLMLKSVLCAAARIVHDHRRKETKKSALNVQSGPESSRLSEVERDVEDIVRDALCQCDETTNGHLTKAEFISWMKRHPVIIDSVLNHTSIRDKQSKGFQYGRIFDSTSTDSYERNSQGPRRAEPLSQTWVDCAQEAVEDDRSICEPAFNGSYASADYLWSPVFPSSFSMPCARSRHSVCVYDGGVFVYGGRGTRGTLKDFWRYDIASNTWNHVSVEGQFRPPCLQEHTALLHKGNMYVFGGEFTATNETPLWAFNFRAQSWRKLSTKSKGPVTRRSHTCVIYEGSMFVFGGYIDMRGATDELWQYELDTSKWIKVKWKGDGPSPRYSHTAAAGEGGMWVYGGLEGLQSRNDLWRWSFVSHSWSKIKSRGGPPALFGHSAIKVGDGMLIFGGETADGTLQNTLWRLDLGNRTWSTVRPRGGISPPVRSCLSMGVVPSSAFLLSIRPSSSHSAPPCTPMPTREDGPVDRQSSGGTSWCDPLTRWERSVASLDSLDPNLHPSTSKGNEDRLLPGFSTRWFDNTRAMNLSEESLHERLSFNVSPPEAHGRNQALSSHGILPPKGLRVHSQELLSRDNFVSADLRKCLARPFACLLLLGGKTHVQADMGRSLDIWRCDIDPVKTQNEHVEKILVTEQQATRQAVPYVRFERAPSESTADDDNEGSVDGDLTIVDMSDGDTRSVDWLLTDDGCVNPSYGFPQVSI